MVVSVVILYPWLSERSKGGRRKLRPRAISKSACWRDGRNPCLGHLIRAGEVRGILIASPLYPAKKVGILEIHKASWDASFPPSSGEKKAGGKDNSLPSYHPLSQGGKKGGIQYYDLREEKGISVCSVLRVPSKSLKKKKGGNALLRRPEASKGP